MTTVYIVRYNFNEETQSCTWDLVTSEQKAMNIDSNYELASRGDLVDYMASSGYIFEGLLQTKEGVCMYDVTYDEDGEIEKYGYELTHGLATV